MADSNLVLSKIVKINFTYGDLGNSITTLLRHFQLIKSRLNFFRFIQQRVIKRPLTIEQRKQSYFIFQNCTQ
jgi:hypothetical protein